MNAAKMSKRCTLLLAVLSMAACASGGGTQPVAAQTPVDTTRTLASARDTIPVGFGSLRQDELTIAIRTDALLLKVTPLNERVIRLMAPDTYRRLHALVESRRNEVSRGIGTRELFLVSFFSYQPDVTYQPEDVQLSHLGRTLRPEAIAALTPGWGKQQMAQQATESAIYAFEGPIDYEQDIGVRYGTEESQAWHTIIARMQVERAKVKARAGK
ncbi:MAG: hypothetical protein ABIV28_04680 [Longimicrobiales bacterium]